MEKKKNQMSFQFHDYGDGGRERDERQSEERKEAEGINKERTEWNIASDSWTEKDYAPSTSPGLPLNYYQKRRKKNSWTEAGYIRSPKQSFFNRLKKSSKVLLTAVGAIGVGVILGMMVLSIFSNLGQEESTSRAVNPEQPEGKAQTENQANGSSEEDVSTGSSNKAVTDQDNPVIIPSGNVQDRVLDLPARSYFVVQAGAFSDLDAAKTIIDKYKNNGWAGLLLGAESPYRLYIGLSQNKKDALLLGQYYDEQGVEEIYVKEHLTPPVTQIKVQAEEGILQLLPTFLAKGDQLVAKLGEISAYGIMDPEYVLTLEEWNKVQELHRSFLQDGKQLFSKWTGEEEQFGEKMMHELTAGVNALETFRKQSHATYLWKVQQASLQYVKEYEGMVADLTSNAE
jgi:stage II sporulation protein B